jgi:CBS domain-containing protein
MRTIDALYRSGIAIEPDRTIRDAAKVMEGAGVGSLAVLDHDRLVGIVTDRDLVRRALAGDVSPDARVDAVMSAPVVTISADADIDAAFTMFAEHGIRRLPVMDEGRFAGMLVVDDLLVSLSQHLADLVRPITNEAMFPDRESPVPATLDR